MAVNAHIAGLPRRVAYAYVLAFALACWFYTLLWPTAPIMVPDSGGYLRAARAIASLANDQLQDRAPGYPLFLVLTGATHNLRWTFIASLLVHCASVWLLASVLYRAGATQLTTTLFGLVLLLPPYVESAGYIRTETLAEAGLAVAFVGLVDWHARKTQLPLAICALAVGAVALVRPSYQLLFAALSLLILFARFAPRSRVTGRDALRASVALACASALIIGGYAFYNYRTFGYLGVTPKFGLTLSTKTARVVERLPDEHRAIREVLVKARNAELLADPAHTGQMYIWNVAGDLTSRNPVEQARLSGYMLRLNLLLVRQAPLMYLQEVVWALGSYWFPAAGPLANLDSRVLQAVWVVLHFCVFGAFGLSLVLLVGAAGLLASCTRSVGRLSMPADTLIRLDEQAFAYALAGTIVFYTAAVSCLIEVGDPRYRLPTDSLILFMLFLAVPLWRGMVDVLRPPLDARRAIPATTTAPRSGMVSPAA